MNLVGTRLFIFADLKIRIHILYVLRPLYSTFVPPSTYTIDYLYTKTPNGLFCHTFMYVSCVGECTDTCIHCTCMWVSVCFFFLFLHVVPV